MSEAFVRLFERAGVSHRRAAGLCAASLLLGCGLAGAAALQDAFAGSRLDPSRWKVTRKGDFQESVVDVKEGRLRLRMATIGTRDDTVKFHGVRTADPVDTSKGVDLSFDMDWNHQANGCYLTAGIFLCPTETGENPAEARDWLQFEYVGVPPGKNARAVVAVRQNGNLRHLYTEGWPEKQRTGRQIGRQHVRLRLEGKRLTVWENGEVLFRTDACPVSFARSYLYLQMSCHSNYPPREVFFDNVSIQAPAPKEP